MKKLAIQTKGISKTYYAGTKKIKALSNLSIKVETGEFISSI